MAERKNRNIVWAMRAMCIIRAYHYTCGLRHATQWFMFRTIAHYILEMMTLEEAYSSKRSDVSHFRIFGSSVYFHVIKDAWNKLEPTTELGIFVGYTDTP